MAGTKKKVKITLFVSNDGVIRKRVILKQELIFKRILPKEENHVLFLLFNLNFKLNFIRKFTSSELHHPL